MERANGKANGQKIVMKILDWYILKKFITTFIFTLLILIPIAVAIDIAEKIDKFLAHPELTGWIILDQYYKNFIIYYANTFMPLALFIAVILFTSKLSSNTEIVAMGNARISFVRFLYPYFIGASIITVIALAMNHFVVPSSSVERKSFEKEYINRKKVTDDFITDFSLQLGDGNYIFLKSYNFKYSNGNHFSIENYDGLELKEKINADNIRWNKKDSSFRLSRYTYRKLMNGKDSIQKGMALDTVFSFTPNDFIYKSTIAQEMPTPELKRFIEISKKRGVKNLNAYLVELQKRTSLPMASYILTIIAVALAYKKKRGGLGMNLAIGISIMFIYVFFLKVSEVLGAVAGVNSLLYVWFPNLVFGGVAAYLFNNARK